MGLTETQRARLATLRSAQARADALSKRFADEARNLEIIDLVAKMNKRRDNRRRQGLNEAISRPPERPECDHPKQARDMVDRPTLTWLMRRSLAPVTPDAEATRAQFELCRSLSGFAAAFDLSRTEGKAALKEAGIDLYAQVASDWDANVSIRELSRRHGVGKDTIARWIRRAGRSIPLGNCRKRYSEELILESFAKVPSCNRAAKAAGVSWLTAKNVLVRHGKWGVRVKGAN